MLLRTAVDAHRRHCHCWAAGERVDSALFLKSLDEALKARDALILPAA